MGAERPRDQAQLDGAEALVAVDAEGAELDERRPQRARARRARLVRLARQPATRGSSSVSTDSLSQVCSSVSSRSIAYSWGSARMRSAMMLRWICCVPPYTLAAREYR